MRRSAIVCAFPAELRGGLKGLPLRRLRLKQACGLGTLSCGRTEIDLAAIGVGAVLAGEGLRELGAPRAPQRILMIGIAGGLQPTLAAGESLLADWVKPEWEGGPFELRPTAALREVVRGALVGRQLREGGIVSSRRIICQAGEKIALGHSSSALAVDMESWTVGQFCQAHGIEWAVLRVIADGAEEELPDLNRCFDLNKGFLRSLRHLNHRKAFAALATLLPAVVRALEPAAEVAKTARFC
jgi:nucleoside phosphorylase